MRLLVPEQHKDAVRGFIDRNDMRGLVEYSIVTAVSAHQPRPLPSTLAGKLVVDLDHPHGRWLAAQLTQRFQHACVESAREMDDHRLAVTVHGTTKMPGNHYRKDDRPELTSPSSYILGADTARKRSALAAELDRLDTKARTTAATAEELNTQLGRARAGGCGPGRRPRSPPATPRPSGQVIPWHPTGAPSLMKRQIGRCSGYPMRSSRSGH